MPSAGCSQALPASWEHWEHKTQAPGLQNGALVAPPPARQAGASLMTNDFKSVLEPAAFLPSLEAMQDLPADAVVRVAVGWLAEMLREYGLRDGDSPSAANASEVLKEASALLGSFAADLQERADNENGFADGNASDLLAPSIRQAFVKGCAPAPVEGLERAICDYRLAHMVIAGLDSPQLVWNDPEAGKSPAPAKVRKEIAQVIKAAKSFRDCLSSVSGEALGRISLARYEADGTMGFARTVFELSGELIPHAETALDEMGDSAGSGRTLAPKTRLALSLGDLLASSGVPVIVDGKPSEQWALAYDLALEASGDGLCSHAPKTLQNVIELRRKERIPPTP